MSAGAAPPAKRQRRGVFANAAPEAPEAPRGGPSASWSNFFGGEKRAKETTAGGQLNDVVAIPRDAQPGDDEMEDAFMAFGAPTRKRPPPGFTPPGAAAEAAAGAESADSAPAVSEPAPRGNTSAPRGAGGGARYGGAPGPSLPSGKRGVSSFLNRRAGASTFASPTKPADPNSVEAIQYRKDMANAKAAGVPYSTWVKKSREDLSTLTWQELAERMKKPYDPDSRDFTDDAGAR